MTSSLIVKMTLSSPTTASTGASSAASAALLEPIGWRQFVDARTGEVLERRESVLAFDVRGGLEGGRLFVESVELAQLATSLGGPETLVTHPASTTHRHRSSSEGQHRWPF